MNEPQPREDRADPNRATGVPARPSPAIDTVVFDVGNVLIPWNPRWLLGKLLPDEAALERFLDEVDFGAWNEQHDAGLPFADGIARLGARFPHYRQVLQAFFDRWEETIADPFPESVALARALRSAGYRTFALTNFSAETYPRALRRNPFLDEFEGIVVSGREGMIKPDPAIYRLLCTRYAVTPERCVFIDDNPRNVEGARAVGMHALHFTDVERLAGDLAALGVQS